MADEHDRRSEYDRLQQPPDRHEVLRRDDPEHLGLLSDVREIKKDVADLTASHERAERQLLGHWNDEERVWKPGLLQEMQALRKLGFWILGVVTTVGTGLLILGLQNWFHLSHATVIQGGR